MVELWLVGIGTGNPAHVTLEAQAALRAAALVMVPMKGPEKSDLAALRHTILTGCGRTGPVVEFDMPTRDAALPYLERVSRWHDAIATIWAETIETHQPAGPVALLVWGDPGLYDSTLRIAGRLSPRPSLRVLPGITALQALTAAHAIPFNTVGGAVHITTGRRLRDHGWPKGAETVAVMLDGECSFQNLDPSDLYIWWGGNLGLATQALDAGSLAQTGPRIVDIRAHVRASHGWIMDCYILRRSDPTRADPIPD